MLEKKIDKLLGEAIPAGIVAAGKRLAPVAKEYAKKEVTSMAKDMLNKQTTEGTNEAVKPGKRLSQEEIDNLKKRPEVQAVMKGQKRYADEQLGRTKPKPTTSGVVSDPGQLDRLKDFRKK